MKSAVLFLLVISFGISGCSKKISDLSIINHGENFLLPGSSKKDSLKIKFFGTTSFLFEYKSSTVFTDPFISNPPLRKVLFGKLRTDSAVVSKYITKKDIEKIKVVVVGHAHYDHLMDLPFVAKDMKQNAIICGSESMKHCLTPAKLPQQFVTVNDLAGDSLAAGKWIYTADNTIRIMAFRSDHPPHFGKMKLYGGSYQADLEKYPLRSKQWLQGEPFSYLIDFLDGNEIAYRIFFQSSGADAPLGFYPGEFNDGKNVDLAVYSVALCREPEVYPYHIIRYSKPDVVFMAHWENLFRAKDKPLKAVQKGDPEGMYHSLNKEFPAIKFVLAAPGSGFSVR